MTMEGSLMGECQLGNVIDDYDITFGKLGITMRFNNVRGSEGDEHSHWSPFSAYNTSPCIIELMSFMTPLQQKTSHFPMVEILPHKVKNKEWEAIKEPSYYLKILQIEN